MADDMIRIVSEALLKLLFSALKNEADYICKSTEIVNSLKTNLTMLKDRRKRIEEQIRIANSKGDDPPHGSKEWVKKTNDLVSRVEKTLPADEDSAKKSCIRCQNLCTLYQYGKTAMKNSGELQQQHKEGEIFDNCSSVPTSAPGFLELFPKNDLTGIDTQNSTLSKIIEAIIDENVQVINIHGTGGVGKTTLAVEAARDSTVCKLFADVVFIPVSRNPDYEKIRKEAQVAAKRIKNKEKVLIILDDVWQPLKMSECGIPCGKGNMNCKILVTSRNKDMCLEMTDVRSICIGLLTNEEAWLLFKRLVGESVANNSSLEAIAKQIVKECGGLPLLIDVVGKVLKDKDEDMWKAVRDRMNDHATPEAHTEIKKKFLHLSLSYEYLKEDNAKLCFLLCSMFPEDSFISLERLALYGVGLEMFDSLKVARSSIKLLVDTLKSHSLLLTGNSYNSTRMHDTIRQVAWFITKTDQKNNFLVKSGNCLKQWPPNRAKLEQHTGISLMKNNISELSRKIEVPKLDILLLQDNPELSMISDEFIKGLKNVRVLDMEHTNISPLPSSMYLLTKLRFLNLGGNRSLSEISVVGQLTELEILILNDTSIEQIPEEIGQLTFLRLLEVRRCYNLSHIANGVISKLSLEELNIEFYSVQESTYSSLEKLSEVPSYLVQIGGDHETSFDIPLAAHSANCLILEIPFLPLPNLMPIKKLIEASDYIYLKSIENVSHIMPNLHSKGLNEGKTVQLIHCKNVSCLVDTRDWDETKTCFSSNELGEKFFSEMQSVSLRDMANLEVLWNCPHQYISFCKLESMSISLCPNLAKLIPVSIAQGLVNLRSIALSDCGCLDVVIWAEDEETSDTMIEFPKLTTINLDQLPKLKSFHSGDYTIKYPSLQSIKVSGCSSLNTWGSGHHEIPKIKYHYQGKLCNINDFLAICSEKNEAMTFENRVMEADFNG